VNCAENVAVHNERSRHGGCEDDPVGFAWHHGYAGRKVGAYRETVRLHRVLIADEDANHITLVHSNDRPGIRRSSMAYAIVEP